VFKKLKNAQAIKFLQASLTSFHALSYHSFSTLSIFPIQPRNIPLKQSNHENVNLWFFSRQFEIHFPLHEEEELNINPFIKSSFTAFP
jgi:hypothetical protein